MDDKLPVPVSILRVRHETFLIRTFVFDRSFTFSPGQFVMVWVPGVDEIPMALSSENTITVQNAGDATSAMFNLGTGDKLGIRGPFGNGFTKGEKVLAIAGGVGAAPLLPLASFSEPGQKTSSCLLTSWMSVRMCSLQRMTVRLDCMGL
jgi:dihydroorotate dehydrogenase electron transfer subunit